MADKPEPSAILYGTSKTTFGYQNQLFRWHILSIFLADQKLMIMIDEDDDD